MKKQRKRKWRGMAFLLAGVMASTSLGSNVMTVQSAEQDVDMVVEINEESNMLPFQMEQENIMLEFKLVNDWGSGYQAEIILTNQGTDTVEGWQLDFVTSDMISNIWNGKVLQNDQTLCSITDAGYNRVIKPEESISIGYCATGNSHIVTDLKMMVTAQENDKEETGISVEPYMYEYEMFTVEYSIQNIWEENCAVCMKIINTSDTIIENWKLAWKSEDTISGLYNGEMSQEDGLYLVKNSEYNQDILPGDTVELGFQVNFGENLDIPEGFILLSEDTQISEEKYVFENVVTNAWDDGCTGEIYITNISNQVMEDWYLTIQSEVVITNMWNGSLIDLENGMYGIKNPQYHQNLKPNETIVIGYQADGDTSDTMFPIMLTASVDGDASGDALEGDTGNDTTEEDGNTEDITGDKDFEEDKQPAEDHENTGDTDKGEDPEEDKVTGEGEKTEEDGNKENLDKEEEILKENYIEISTAFDTPVDDNAYRVETLLNTYEGKLNNLSKVRAVSYQIVDAFENIVLSGDLLYDNEDGNWIIEDFGLVIGWNDVIFTVSLKDDTVVTESFSYVNASYENMENTSVNLQDDDGDGINNYYETIYGTDYNKVDTDGDTLTDYQELMVVGTNPVLYDTDSDGVRDGDEDTDEDGLTSLEELSHGTSPLYADCDLDNIDDKAEIYITGTDPLKEDTDEDGLLDGEELKLGTNPLVKDSDGNGIRDGEEKIEQQVTLETEEDMGAVRDVSVSLACSGDIENQVFMENMIGKDILSSEVVGLIGAPINIESMAPFDEAVISFHYDKELLGNTKEEDLGILWYDEENMQYVLLEDTVVDTTNQTVSYTTEHFSTYLLIDKDVWLDVWRAEINYGQKVPANEGATYDIMICMDYDVSKEEYEKEKEFAKKIIEQMVDGDRVKLCVYEHGVCAQEYIVTDCYYHMDWITNKVKALKALDNIEEEAYKQRGIYVEPSGAYMTESYGAVNKLVRMYDETTTNKQIAFCVNSGKNEQKGNVLCAHSAEKARGNLEKLKFPVHLVSVTDQENSEFAALLSEYGGKSFKATTLEDMKIQFKKFDVDADDEIDMFDTDGDGLYDTYEVNGMRIQNGKIVYTDPYEKDTDGDGINDFDEVGGLPQNIVSPTFEYVSTINYQVSDPNDPNSVGKQLKMGYMMVDNMNYLPYDKENYEKIFINDTTKLDVNDKKIYGLYNIYNSKPGVLTKEQVEKIRSKVEIQCFGVGPTLALPANFLKKYIYNTDERNFYLCEGVLRRNASVRQNLANEAWYMMVAAQEYLDANETIILTQTPDNQNSGVELVPINYDIGTGLDLGIGDFLGIHYAKTRLVSKVSFDGTNYIMDLKYYLFDYYDWDEKQTARLGLVSDSELYQMCRCGAARFYENWGVYETQIVWNLEENSGQNALKAEKMYLSMPFVEK